MFADVDQIPSPSDKSVVMDLLDVWMHEIAHVFAGGDTTSSSCTNAVCYEYISYGETKKRALTIDDQNALCTVYGGHPASQSTSSTCSGIVGGLSSPCVTYIGYS